MPETIKTDSGNLVTYRTKGPMSIDDIVKLEYLCDENPDILPKEQYIKEKKNIEYIYPEASIKECWILKSFFAMYPARVDQVELDIPYLAAQEIVFACKELKCGADELYIYSTTQKDIHCITGPNPTRKLMKLVCCFGKDAVPLIELEKEAIELFKKTTIKKLSEIESLARASIERLRKDEYVITNASPEAPYCGSLP